MVAVMGILKDSDSGDTIPLAARIVVGRATTASLRLVDKRVSGEHATVRWTGTGWEVRDLGSRNGTFVDGVRVGAGEAAAIRVGTRLSFGDPAPRFDVIDASAPGPVARDLRTGAWRAAEGGMLALPSSDRPECVVYGDPAGGWFAEGDDRRAVTDGDVLEVGGVPFALALPEMVDGTATVERSMRLDTIGLRFGVSRDEEHVALTVVHRGEPIPLEPREHGYVLLTLARQRLADAAEPSAEQGWVDRDRLLKMLQLDANGLNVAIYRARGQLASIGVDDAAGIVEVRRGQRRIGIAPERLDVRPLE
jgi:hypothetical protein